MKYTVTAERSGKWWVLQATDVPGAISQVARLDQADVIKEAIAFVAGVAESDVEITLRPVVSAAVSHHLARSVELRSAATEANAQSAVEARLAARELSNAGITLRDIGELMGVSFQRAGQLVK
jgi:hypothetical protein